MIALLAALLLAAPTTHAQDVPPWRAVGFYDHDPIRESSGLVVSRQHKDVYWTLNDSGNPAALYATGLDGKLIREFEVEGSRNRDWEALASDNSGQLWIGEIGNNSRERTDLRIYLVKEPDPQDASATVSVIGEYPYRYPNENVDAEGLFIHEGMPHIISKEADRAVLYRFTSLDSKTQHELERVGELSHGAFRITGASLNDEGTRLAAVTYNRLWVYHSVRPISLVNLIRSKPWSMPHDFGVEACAFQGDDLILTNEARSIFLLPDYWYKRGDSLPPQGTLSALDLPSAQVSGTVLAESYQTVGIPIPGKHLVLRAKGPGASLTQKVEIERDDLWEINTVVTRGPAYGRFELLVDGNVIGSPYDSGAKENTAGTLATFGKTHLEKGVREFTLRLTGEPGGTRIGIDGYLIQAAAPFARRFMVVGPFERANPQNIDEKFGPETGTLNLSDAYTGVGNQEVFWQTADASATGRLDLLRAFPKAPSIAQAYALTAVFSETERDAILLVGADDQVAVWVNGTEVHRNNWRGGASPDEDAISCRLQAGWNQVLCKIGQNGGNWALYLRFNDPDGSLRYTIAAR